ncbi:MAG: hypothetical protein ABL902_01580 [Gallionella sp.]
MWDATQTSCILDCTIPDLTPIQNITPYIATDWPATQLLEDHKNDNNPPYILLEPAADAALTCLKEKATSIGVTIVANSGTRTQTYQRHFREIWTSLIKIDALKDSNPDEYKACLPLRAKIQAEKNAHGITDEPAANSNHPKGNAFDIKNLSIASLRAKVSPPIPRNSTWNDKQYAAEQLKADIPKMAAWLVLPNPAPKCTPPANNLQWGGSFQKPDKVHFQIP